MRLARLISGMIAVISASSALAQTPSSIKLPEPREVHIIIQQNRYGDGELSRVGGTYGVAVGGGGGALSDLGAVSIFGAVSTFGGLLAAFGFARGFSSDTAVVDRFEVFDFDVAVGTKCTETGFG